MNFEPIVYQDSAEPSLSLGLKKSLNRLTEVAPDDSPLLSCFLDLECSRLETLRLLEKQASSGAQQLPFQKRAAFEEAFAKICAHFTGGFSAKAKGAAIYSRQGDNPFFLLVEFQVPLETRLVVDSLPHIYPIVETKDIYQRCAIVVVTEEETRVVETVVGAITHEIFAKCPEPYEELDRRWIYQHHQNRKKERNKKFLQTKIRILDELTQQRGHNYLVIAGSPEMVSEFTRALPKRLQKKILTTLHSDPRHGVYPIVQQAIDQCVEEEHAQSHSNVSRLENEVFSNGLGVVGIHDVYQALSGSYAELLVIDSAYEADSIKEKLVRLATRNGVPIETVRNSETLRHLSGVGCLLRYKPKIAFKTNTSLVA